MKNDRKEAIIEIVRQYEIDTQEGLLQKLQEKGFSVTQATVSRDIKKIGLVKVAAPSGKYKYAYRAETDQQSSAKFSNILKETVVRVAYTDALIVLHTYAGMANASAAAFDSMFKDDVLGSIAGDDTIFIAVHSRETAVEITEKIRQIIGK